MGVNLDKLERLYKQATPGEWKAEPVQLDGKKYATTTLAWQFVEPNICGLWAERGENYADGEFIAALHNAFPALLALARDGERYRWLREHTDSMSIEPPLTVARVSGWGLEGWSGDDLTAAIDAARKGEQE